MNRLKTKKNSLKLRKARIRKTVTGTAERPRMSVHISSQHVTAQLVDDEKSNTLVHITTVGNKKLSNNMTERATWVGTEAAKRAKLKKIKKVVFDRNGKLYHGRVKALADAAREGGLEL